MTETNISIINMEPKIICGIATRTSNSKEFNPETSVIGRQWDRFYSDRIAQSVLNPVSPKISYGVYSQYESDHLGEYTLLSGVESETEEQVNPDLLSITLDAGRYLVFEVRGELPAGIIDTWGYIWDYFDKNRNVRRKFTTDFELYSPEGAAIYISII